MFDLTSSKLLILGLVALIVVGPKDLPLLLRTIGKYVGMIRRQANEFRAQFDEAMREQELANLKSEMEAVKRDVESTIGNATAAVKDDIAASTRDIDAQLQASVPNHGWSDPISTESSLPPEPAPSVIARPLDAAEHAELEHRINGAMPPAPVTQQPAPHNTPAADPAPKAGA